MIMGKLWLGKLVEFQTNFTIDLGDVRVCILKGSTGVIVHEHQDNLDIEDADVYGLWLVELPQRHNYRVWVRGRSLA